MVPPLNATPLRIILGFPLILFLPGYSLICALFPEKNEMNGIERIALSIGLSIAVAAIIGLVLNYTPWGIRLGSHGVGNVFIHTDFGRDRDYKKAG